VNFKEGDIVQNIHTRKVGEAGEKIDAYMQDVWYEDDDEPIPTFISDLILYSSNHAPLQAPFLLQKSTVNDGNHHLIFLPDTQSIGGLHLFAINGKNKSAEAHIKWILKGKNPEYYQIKIQPGEVIHVLSTWLDVINDSPRITTAFHDSADSKQVQRYELILRSQHFIKKKKFFAPLNAEVYGYKLQDIGISDTHLIFDIQQIKKSMSAGKFHRPMIDVHRPSKEIDLHADKLGLDSSKISKAEILIIQKNTCLQFIEAALSHQYKNITIIHGIGSGKLREEIWEILTTYPEIRSFKPIHEGAVQVNF
jgi:hypothetical protein